MNKKGTIQSALREYALTSKGREKIAAAILAHVLSSKDQPQVALSFMLEFHGLTGAAYSEFAVDVALRLEAFAKSIQSREEEQDFAQILTSDKSTLGLARTLARATLVTTPQGHAFAYPPNLKQFLDEASME